MREWLVMNSNWIVPLSATVTVLTAMAALVRWLADRASKTSVLQSLTERNGDRNCAPLNSEKRSASFFAAPIRFIYHEENEVAPRVSATIKSAIFRSLNSVFTCLVHARENSQEKALPSILVGSKVFYKKYTEPDERDNPYYIDGVYLSCDILDKDNRRMVSFSVEGIDKSAWLGFFPDAVNDAAKQLRKYLNKWIRSYN